VQCLSCVVYGESVSGSTTESVMRDQCDATAYGMVTEARVYHVRQNLSNHLKLFTVFPATNWNFSVKFYKFM